MSGQALLLLLPAECTHASVSPQGFHQQVDNRPRGVDVPTPVAPRLSDGLAVSLAMHHTAATHSNQAPPPFQLPRCPAPRSCADVPPCVRGNTWSFPVTPSDRPIKGCKCDAVPEVPLVVYSPGSTAVVHCEAQSGTLTSRMHAI